ncbi:MAG: DUF1501 domain-containing protein [Cyanobacteria bacterium J06639_16]
MKLTRRMCLLAGAGVLGTTAIRPINRAILGAPSPASSSSRWVTGANPDPELLVIVFLRGGCDGLNLVAPVDDPHYIAARPANLRVHDRGAEAGLPLSNPPADLDFRLHSAAPELKELYDNGSLAIVHACGLTHGTRSHFEAQALMELGTATDKGLTTGWLSRAIAPTDTSGIIPAVALSPSLPMSLWGTTTAISMTSLEDFVLPGEADYATVLNQLYQGTSPAHAAGNRLLTALQAVDVSDSQREAILADLEAVESYSDEYAYDFGRGLRTIATLARLDVGLQVATIDYDGWDTHADQAWEFSELVAGLSQSLSAFYQDISRDRNRVTVLVMTEFGRRLRANESSGTDHGFGSVMLALGEHVNGGRIFGQWPGLATEQLDRGADLAITTDFRHVLGEYLTKRLQTPSLEAIFPDLSAYEPPDIFKA